MKTYEYETSIFRLIPHWDATELEVPINIGISGSKDEPEISYCKVLKDVEFENITYFKKGEQLTLTQEEFEEVFDGFLKSQTQNDYDDN